MGIAGRGYPGREPRFAEDCRARMFAFHIDAHDWRKAGAKHCRAWRATVRPAGVQIAQDRRTGRRLVERRRYQES